MTRRVLDIGCGTDPDPSADVTMDIADLPTVDYVHDITDDPWPFVDGDFDVVIARHVFEHLPNPEVAFRESARVLTDGGVLKVTVPLGLPAYTDPTHEHIWTWATPEFFTGDGPRSYYYDLPLKLEDRSVDVRLRGPARPLTPVLRGVVSVVDRVATDLEWLSATPWLGGEMTATFRVTE